MTQKIAVITGGAGGLGSSTCKALARENYHVVILDVRAEAIQTLMSNFKVDGYDATGMVVDLASNLDIQKAINDVVVTHGKIDVLINNAGIDLTQPVLDMPLEQWDKIMAVNLRAPFILSKAVLTYMKERQQGYIINIVSTAALRAWPNASAYHASKWGLLGFSHALHSETRGMRIRVTAVIAGGMKTPFLTDRFPDIDVSCLQEPDNVSQMILHLLNTPEGTVIPEVKILPMKETSWP